MPANEATWRNTQQLHRIFAVSGVLLTISTVWMFWKDHARSWKTYQVQANDVDLKMNELRQKQFETGEALITHTQRSRELIEVKASAVDAQLLEEFVSQAHKLDDVLAQWRKYGYPYSLVSVDEKRVQDDAQKLPDL